MTPSNRGAKLCVRASEPPADWRRARAGRLSDCSSACLPACQRLMEYGSARPPAAFSVGVCGRWKHLYFWPVFQKVRHIFEPAKNRRPKMMKRASGRPLELLPFLAPARAQVGARQGEPSKVPPPPLARPTFCWRALARSQTDSPPARKSMLLCGAHPSKQSTLLADKVPPPLRCDCLSEREKWEKPKQRLQAARRLAEQQLVVLVARPSGRASERAQAAGAAAAASLRARSLSNNNLLLAHCAPIKRVIIISIFHYNITPARPPARSRANLFKPPRRLRARAQVGLLAPAASWRTYKLMIIIIITMKYCSIVPAAFNSVQLSSAQLALVASSKKCIQTVHYWRKFASSTGSSLICAL